MSADPTPERIVKPRRPHASPDLPIIAVCFEDQQVLVERTGQIFGLEILPSLFKSHESSMVITSNAPRLLKLLDDCYKGDETWQYRISPDKREIRHPTKPEIRRRITGTIVGFFGWSNPTTKKKGRYHYPLDPTLFARQPIHELVADDIPRVLKLVIWGKDVQRWIAKENLRPTPTNGGIAGQLLRDPRWFPEPRRKVPKATNARARASLPGNYYKLLAPEGRAIPAAVYLDMAASHHNMTERTTFPNPNTLYAYGRFRVPDVTGVTVPESSAWAKPGSALYRRLTDGSAHGLLYCHLSVPPLKPTQFPLPCAERSGLKMAWVYTNELEYLRSLGVIIDYVSAALVSYHVHDGLNQYSRWAMAELAESRAERKRWLKPALLATYGVLAARPRVQEFGFKRAKGGVERRYPAGSGLLTCLARVGSNEQETPVANVIYRGLIESEQRVETLRMARSLHACGHNVLAIYADSVFVADGIPLPILPHPWTVQATLDNLMFWCPTAFTSRQLTKLPGIPKEAQERQRIIERAREGL